VLCGNLAPVGAYEFASDQVVSGRRYIYFSRQAALFHTCAGVYRIAPNVVGEFFYAHYTCYDGAAVYAYADIESGFGPGAFTVLHKGHDFQRGTYGIFRMGFYGRRQPAHGQVGIADG